MLFYFQMRINLKKKFIEDVLCYACTSYALLECMRKKTTVSIYGLDETVFLFFTKRVYGSLMCGLMRPYIKTAKYYRVCAKYINYIRSQ